MTARDSDLGVEELMHRVRREVERRRLEARMREGGSPPVRVDDQAAASWQAVREAIAAAEPVSVVGQRLPPMSQQRGLRRRIAVPVARLILRAAELFTRDQTAFNRLMVELVRMLANTVDDRLGSTSRRIDALADGLAQAIAQGRPVSELVEAGIRTASELRAARERIAGLEDIVARLDSGIAELVRRLEEARQAEQARVAEAERLRAENARVLAHLERSVTRLAEGGAGAPAAPSGGRAALDDTVAHLADAFYVAFEDRFRGARDDVKERMRVYLPIVTDAGAGTPERPVLDVGCGRGEWLELLGEHGLVGRGIDRNETMVLESRARGLAVVEGDALTHLRALPASSLGAITGMHVLEHVEFPMILQILDECTRVLQPGGVAIFETPNPRNLVVGACQFHVDPTHRTPLHPDTMAFVAEFRGLARVRILPLHPVDGDRELAEDDSPIVRVLNDYLFGPQDFAVIGYRP